MKFKRTFNIFAEIHTLNLELKALKKRRHNRQNVYMPLIFMQVR
jgi:hypothetical protein